MKTHIETLSDNTHKSRRRVRKTVGLTTSEVVKRHHVVSAQIVARQRERKGAQVDAEKRLAEQGGQR